MKLSRGQQEELAELCWISRREPTEHALMEVNQGGEVELEEEDG